VLQVTSTLCHVVSVLYIVPLVATVTFLGLCTELDKWKKKNYNTPVLVCHIMLLLMPAHPPIHNLISKQYKEVTYLVTGSYVEKWEEAKVDKASNI